MNKYSTFTRALELEPQPQVQFSVIFRTLLQGIQLAYSMPCQQGKIQDIMEWHYGSGHRHYTDHRQRNGGGATFKDLDKAYRISISNRATGLMSRVFANGPGDWGSIPGQVIIKRLQKMIHDTSLLNSQHYKVRIKGKVEQSREWSSALPYTLVR